MAVMVSPREKWTDERLDDLSQKVDFGFARVEGDLREIGGDVKNLNREMNARFDSMEERFDARFDALNRTLIGAAAGIAVAFVGSTATLAGVALL
ncbi:MAG TPA: hypothetical protein VFN92_09925 [Solirubrobacterales bacterium]|nr:hypothetical protein [Solirubrobacterales bacterium]